MGNSDGYSGGAVFLSFLLGGIVGAAVALMMTPESGETMRRRVKDFADDTTTKASDYVEQTRGRITSAVEKGRELYEEKKSAITSAIEAGKDAYEKEKEKYVKESADA